MTQVAKQALNKTIANPAVTPSDPTVHAIRGPRTNGLVLRCFVAGLPPPSGGTWRYNGGPLPSSVVDLLFGEIMLGTNINSSHAGRYTFTVTTSEGTATANIDVATFCKCALQKWTSTIISYCTHLLHPRWEYRAF